MCNKILETRFYNTDPSTGSPIDEGIIQVNFRAYGAEIITAGKPSAEHIYSWFKRYYPQIIADLKSDPLPTKFSTNYGNSFFTRWIRVR